MAWISLVVVAAFAALIGDASGVPTEGKWFCAVKWNGGKGVKAKSFDLATAQSVLGRGSARNIQAIIPMTGSTSGDPHKLDKSWDGGSMWWHNWNDINAMRKLCSDEVPPNAPQPPTAPQPGPRRACPEMDVDYYSHDLKSILNIESYDACDKLCMENENCHAWAWGTPGHPNAAVQKKCHLKKAKFMEGRKVDQMGMVAGKKVCPRDYSYGPWKNTKCPSIPIKPKGCYDLERTELLVYWRYDIEWASDRMPSFGTSFICACHDAAKARGHKFFTTHYWGECWGVDSTKQTTKAANGGDCKAADGTYGPHNKCTDAKAKKFGCLGVENYYLYEITA